jgi:hypothetical protein
MTPTTSKLGADMTDDLAENIARHCSEASILAGNEVCKSLMVKAAETIRALLARQPAAIDKEAEYALVKRGDLVEHSHPQYGGGLFATEDCFVDAPLANEASKPAAPISLEQIKALETAVCNGQSGEALRLLHHMRNALAAPSVEQDERGAISAAFEAYEYQFRMNGEERNKYDFESGWKAARAASISANAPSESGADTGNAEADRIIGRLSSSDPDFDDCIDAVAFIRKLVAEHKGPDGFATWKDAAIAERMRRKTDSDGLRGLFLEALDFGIGFGPRLSEVGEWKETRISKANGLVIRAASTSANVAQGAEAVTEKTLDALKWAISQAALDPTGKHWGALMSLRKSLTAPPAQTALTDDARDAEILRTLIHRAHACDLKFDKAGKVQALHAVFKADSVPGYGMKSSVRRYLDAFMQDAALTAAQPVSGDSHV